MNNKPNYYAIIPAKVRYDENLTLLERFLYTELTALSNVDGYSYAGNKYFADLYKKDVATISRAIAHLSELGYIYIDYERVGTRITKRKIYLNEVKSTIDKIVNGTEITNDKNVNREQEKLLSTIDKIVKENNVSYNNILSLIMYNIKQDLKSVLDEFNFSQQLKDTIYKWLQYKKEKGNSYKTTGFRTLLNKIKEQIDIIGEGKIIQSINSCIANNYQGLFFDNKIKKESSSKQEPKKLLNTKFSKEFFDGLDTDLDSVEV